ncbi:MAG TPA: glycosyltransferase family 2 protein [Magnetospirillaceae bacterium]|jgi:glycosyltransferase involved in cell wall biosynthesis
MENGTDPTNRVAFAASPSPAMRAEGATPQVAVVIPCYRVGDAIFTVLSRIGPEVARIYVVDDRCPENTGDRVEAQNTDERVVVLRHTVNQGVGGALITGYRRALEDGVTVAVKLDGDGQMDPALIPRFVKPILSGQADYTKGNRFYNLKSLIGMPRVRLIGNAVLSFMTKISSGYWRVFDPTNGYTAVHTAALRLLPLDKIARDYFFESDMLFRLNIVRAVVQDVPMDAFYGDEKSGLKVAKVIPRFLARHAANALKRVFYCYFLRDFQLASINLIVGILGVFGGAIFGIRHWILSEQSNVPASAGTVMLATLPIILGVQLLLQAVSYDIQNQPTRPIHKDFEA